MLRGRQAQPYFAGPYLPHQPLAVAKPPISWGTCTCGVASKKPSHKHQADCFGRRRRMKSHKNFFGTIRILGASKHQGSRVLTRTWIPVQSFCSENSQKLEISNRMLQVPPSFVTGWRFPKFWCLQDRGTPNHHYFSFKMSNHDKLYNPPYGFFTPKVTGQSWFSHDSKTFCDRKCCPFLRLLSGSLEGRGEIGGPWKGTTCNGHNLIAFSRAREIRLEIDNKPAKFGVHHLQRIPVWHWLHLSN